jgi:hypothetical protein
LVHLRREGLVQLGRKPVVQYQPQNDTKEEEDAMKALLPVLYVFAVVYAALGVDALISGASQPFLVALAAVAGLLIWIRRLEGGRE